MKNLFLVDGASATGKSDFLKWVMENNADDVGFVVKGTTRAQREYERDDPEILLDLEFLSEEEFKDRNYDYAYTYGGARYGFSRGSLTAELLKRDNTFVIVRNNAIISKIAKEYAFINVVPVFVYTDRAELVQRLEAANLNPDIISFRLQRSEIALRDYYAHPEVYREVLINNSSREVFHTTIERLTILHVEDSKLVADAVREALETEGWTVETCKEGVEAIQLLESDVHYDVLVFDNQLPDIDGVELIRQTRALPHRQQTPIIMLSASDVEREARQAGANVFLQKPNGMMKISETIARLLARKSKH